MQRTAVPDAPAEAGGLRTGVRGGLAEPGGSGTVIPSPPGSAGRLRTWVRGDPGSAGALRTRVREAAVEADLSGLSHPGAGNFTAMLKLLGVGLLGLMGCAGQVPMAQLPLMASPYHSPSGSSPSQAVPGTDDGLAEVVLAGDSPLEQKHRPIRSMVSRPVQPYAVLLRSAQTKATIRQSIPTDSTFHSPKRNPWLVVGDAVLSVAFIAGLLLAIKFNILWVGFVLGGLGLVLLVFFVVVHLRISRQVYRTTHKRHRP